MIEECSNCKFNNADGSCQKNTPEEKESLMGKGKDAYHWCSLWKQK